MSPQIIVIGAGMAGLSCASELVKAGHSVLVVEARNRIGGRTHTDVGSQDGTPMDLGASFIHGLAGNPLHRLAKKHDLSLYQPPAATLKSRHYIYSPSGPPLPEALAARLSHNSLLNIFDSSATFAQDRPNAVPQAHESLADYVLDETRSTLFDGLEDAQEKGYAAQMSESWDGWTGAQLKDVSLRYWQSDQTFRGPDAVIASGYRGIYEPFASAIRQDAGSDIVLGKEVTAISLADDGDSIDITTRPAPSANIASGGDPHTAADGQERFSAAFVVCTLPLGVLQKRPPAFSPALPKRRIDATHRLGMGLLNKIVLTYSTCFWPPNESFITLLSSEASVAFLPLLKDRALFAQSYKSITGKNTLVFYCGASLGEAVEKLSDEEVSKGMHAILRHHFGSEPGFADAGPESIIVTRWLADPFSCGSYAYCPTTDPSATDLTTPYDFAELARPLWDDRLFFAGEATDVDHYATAHGPLITGQREARRILDKMEALALGTSGYTLGVACGYCLK